MKRQRRKEKEREEKEKEKRREREEKEEKAATYLLDGGEEGSRIDEARQPNRVG